MIIATGTGRCGTKTAAALFGMHHEYNTHPYEPGKLIYPWFKNEGHHGQPFLIRSATLKIHLNGQDLTTFRDASNLYLHFLHVLHEIDPACKVLYLWRDPFQFIRSAYFRGWHQRDIWSFRPSANPAAVEYYRTEDAHFWPQWSDVEKLAWIWVTRNTIGLDRLLTSPLQYAIVRTDRLFWMADQIGHWWGVQPIGPVETVEIRHRTKPKDQEAWDNFWTQDLIDQVNDFPRLANVLGRLVQLSLKGIARVG